MKKKICSDLTIILALLTFVGCGNNTSVSETENKPKAEENLENKAITLAVPDGLPTIGIAKMIKEKPQILKGYDITYTIEQSSETLATSVMKSEPDIAIVPSNLAATAYNKTNGNYKIAGTTGWGSFYLGSTNSNVAIEDLKGKEIYNIGKGLTPDIITRTLFKDKGIDVDNEINFSYVNGVSELAPIILAGKTEYAVIPEPALTTVQTKNENFNVILDLNKEWKAINNSEYGYPQATIIVKKDLVDNESEFVNVFLDKVKESTEFIYNDKETVGDYCEEIGVSAQKTIIIKSIDRSNIKYISIKDSYKEYETYFEKLHKFDPKTIGGKIPDEAIFMEK